MVVFKDLLTRKEPFSGFRFVVYVNGSDIGQFSKVSGLTDETEVLEYREGGDGPQMRKLPGLSKYPNIVLEKGISLTNDLINWRSKVIFLSDTGGIAAPFGKSAFRADVTIQVLTSFPFGTVREFVVFNAWPCKLEYDDLDASKSDIFIEKLELAHEGFDASPNLFKAALSGNVSIPGINE